jgi:hypothetical protein
MKTSIKDSNTTKCNQIWVPNNPYIFTCNALKSVKGPGNTFDLNPKWSRTLPSLIYVSWDIYRDLPSIKKNSNIKTDI